MAGFRLDSSKHAWKGRGTGGSQEPRARRERRDRAVGRRGREPHCTGAGVTGSRECEGRWRKECLGTLGSANT